MTSQGGRRRCIIQKLDFENCIITNMTAKGRRKLRARITREIEKIPDDSEEERPSTTQGASQSSTSPEEQLPSASQATSQSSTSPVLIRRPCQDDTSPVFTKRRKISFQEESAEKLSEHSTIEEVSSCSGSPVFKMQTKTKASNPSGALRNVFGKMTSLDLCKSPGSSSSSLQIDEFTQESKPSVKISSVESSDVKNESFCSDVTSLSACCRDGTEERASDSPNTRESPKSFRRNKKHSLLGRLQKLQQKKASEKLLWQHQNRKISSSSLKLSVVSFWSEGFYFFIKCQSAVPKPETNFLVVDSRWVPNVKDVTEGSVLQLHSPWQKLQVDDSRFTVLLNIICLDILPETEEPVLQKRTFESVPVDQFEAEHKFFIDSLFSVGSSEFLW